MQTSFITQAEQALQQDQLVQAQEIYQHLLAEDPTSALALGGMAALAMRARDYVKAQAFIQRAQAAAPDSLGAKIQQIDLDLITAKYPQAYQASQQALQLVQHPVLHWRAAKSAQALGQWTQAEAAYQQALQGMPQEALLELDYLYSQQEQPQAPQIPDKVFNTPVQAHSEAINEAMALLCLAGEKYTQAESWIAPRLQVTHKSPVALAIQGRICAQTGRLNEAETLFNASIATLRRNPYAYFWLGELFIQLHRYTDAIFCLHQAVQLRPNLHQAWWQLAELVYHRKHTPDKAFAIYQKAVHFNPQSVHIRLKATLCALETQKWQAARTHLDTLIEQKLKGEAAGRCAALNAWWAAQHQDEIGFRTWLNQARMQAPKDMYTLAMQGQAALKDKDYKQAETYFKQVLKTSEYPEKYRIQLAEAQMGRHKWAQATKTLEILLQERPHFLAAREMMMEALFKQKRLPEILPHENWIMQYAPAKAEQMVKEALEKDPENPKRLFNYAKVLYKQEKRRQEALDYVNQALEKDPKFYKAWNLKGNIERDLEDFSAAKQSFEKAIALKPEDNSAYIGLAQAQVALNAWQEARDAAEKAYSLQLDYQACISLALIMKELGGNVEQVINLYDQAITLAPQDPVAKWNKSLVLLDSGSIKEGMELYDFGFEAGPRKPNRKFAVPQWQGESLEGKSILVWREQGVGDEIKDMQCLRPLVEQAKRVVMEVSPRLKPLFKRTFPNADVVMQSTGEDDLYRKDIDYHIPMASVIRYFPKEYPIPPVFKNYLSLDADLVAKWQQRIQGLGSGLKIGFNWRGGLVTAQRAKGYAAIEEWENLFNLQGIHLVNLLYDECQQELDLVKEKFGCTLHTWDDLDLKNDFDQVAALMSQLDLVITPQSSVARLAETLGIESWVATIGATIEATEPQISKRYYPSLLFQRHYTEDKKALNDRVVAYLKQRLALKPE
ncbi:Tetratricopeptide repeat-containing protein [Allopseudospirillum japonicum]|uniref:Tetratricopeptide repeat-containing protein n=1 Tax=Allopseudospirillum japonicum TaxID=64971 RepID=A0A1H6RDK6_9GAMM|nr:tetratricopeptide repeat protein [Allopseudospirillum japonicum]SEI50617.1 Tetratricopeptide repeat-containing protein [Allopseudospirillum japonicum]